MYLEFGVRPLIVPVILTPLTPEAFSDSVNRKEPLTLPVEVNVGILQMAYFGVVEIVLVVVVVVVVEIELRNF